jgi:glycosyltransferase involved in cell wall biosynthesis
MANDGYVVAKELRKMNVDVDLAVNTSDFGMALPEWEDSNMSDKADPYSMEKNIANTWKSPDWVRYFDFFNKVPRKKHLLAKIGSRINLIRMMREYDIVEAHVPFVIYAQFSGMPYVAYDAGWIRYFPYGVGMRDKLARRGYRKARNIIITNPDTFEISDSLAYLDQSKISFCPFAIDPEKYKPLDANELHSKYSSGDNILLFSPARQMWKEKGNDKMIRAYARFLKEVPYAKFVMVGWSVDEENSKALANSLGISDKIEWIKPVPKNQLIGYYNAADIVLDQFVLGSWGTSTPEAMCCGKPVLIYYKKSHVIRAYGEEPPILNSLTEDEIYFNLVKLAKDPDFRLELGKKSREWIIRTHSPRAVAQRHLEILQKSI